MLLSILLNSISTRTWRRCPLDSALVGVLSQYAIHAMHGIDPGILHTNGRVYRISSVLSSVELAGSVPRLCLPISSTWASLRYRAVARNTAHAPVGMKLLHRYTVKETRAFIHNISNPRTQHSSSGTSDQHQSPVHFFEPQANQSMPSSPIDRPSVCLLGGGKEPA